MKIVKDRADFGVNEPGLALVISFIQPGESVIAIVESLFRDPPRL
ncbi:MAG TPA: hypothetical protein VE135_20780 [Pyrinomonadaceae bacterium]|nr:hypothetical protein [Pyrinomonadaceae bacterium]